MISDELLRILGLAFAGIALLAMTTWLVLAAWTARRSRRVAARRPPALALLAEALHGGERERALTALARLSSEDRVAALIEMAFTVAGEQRLELDRIARSAGALDHAKSWARSRRWSRRLRAARLLAFFGEGTETEGERLLDDASAGVRAQAAEWAGLHPSEGRIARLVSMLGDPEARCRFAAREALVDAGREAIPAVAAALAIAPRQAVLPTIETATRLATPDFLGPALALGDDADPRVRAAAASLAAAVGGAQAGAALDRMLADPDPLVRASAARGLGHLGRWRSAAALDGLLDDPEWRVRHGAALALHRMGPTGELLLRRRAAGADPAMSSARAALELAPSVSAAELEAA